VDRRKIATFLHQLADGMDGSGPIRLSIEGRPITIDPPERLEFDVELEDESKRFRRGERSLDIELTWKRTGDDRPLQG
jgi:amphi-Trp domain-containing protein